MTTPDPIRILIADDHPIVREGLVALLNRRPDMQVVAEVSDGRAVVQAFEEHRPDVTLLDLRMPEMGGVEAIETIRRQEPGARIIVLTTFDGDEDIYRAIQAGARAYLLKDTPRQELLETIRAVHAGQRRLPPDVAARLAGRMLAPDLTPRELMVLQQLVAGKSNREIGLALGITEGTVKVHVNSILAKLDVSDRTQAVTEALRRGIVHLE